MASRQTIKRSAPGVRMGDMRSVQDAAAGLTGADAQYALTARAGGGQPNATQLATGLNEVSTVATAADSVQLPAAVAGSRAIVANAGAASMQVFGKAGRTDTINGIAGATGVAHANGLSGEYWCPVDGKWYRNLSA